MFCLACAMPGWPLCNPCVASLKHAPPSLIRGVSVEAGFRHVGAAARLVHNLKYRRSVHAGRLLAAAMVAGVPADASAFVPMPRSFVRRVAYGIDQASVLAKELSLITGLPVRRGLGAPLWWRRQAGADREHRHPVGFREIGPVPARAVLIDDVLTTGTTVISALSAIHQQGISVLVATSAGTMETGTRSFLSLGGDVTQMRETTDYLSHASKPRLRMESFEPGRPVLARPVRLADREEAG
jgi:predicted amidophosphoribosyltransferase